MFTQNVSKHWSRAVMFAFGIGIVCMMLSSTASAQVWDKKTTVTFSAPVEIPGINAQVLPAGTYVFRLLDALSDRNVVQIFSKDESHLYATILAIPNYRLKATDKTVMPFAERTAGSPQALRAWFYPGDSFGQEFVYPKTRAVELAKTTRRPIIYIPDIVAPDIIAPVTTANEPPVTALEEAPLRAVQPTGEEVAVTEVAVPPPVQTASLPKTAGSLPMLALIGLLSLGIAFSLRALCVR
jgi:hypothetical protein